MIDIHSHLLPFVDDGSSSVEASVCLIKKAVDEGVNKIILTPHYNIWEYKLPKEKLQTAFLDFKNHIKALDINVDLYLGEEIYCNEDIYSLIKNNEIITLNETKFALFEFDYVGDIDVHNYVYNLISFGYIPIIAHVERYKYLTFDDIVELKSLGARIQVNSNSVTGDNGKPIQKMVLNLIKNGLVDYVATDAHTKRNCSLKSAYNFVCKKFKEEVANKLFVENAKEIV